MKKTNNEYTKALTSSIENAKEFYAARTEYAKIVNDIITGSKVFKETNGNNAGYCIALAATFDSIAIVFEKENNEGTPIDNIVDLFYKKAVSSGSFNYNFIDNFLDFLTSFAAPYLYSEFVNRNICKCVKYQIPEIAIIDSIDEIGCDYEEATRHMAAIKDIKDGYDPKIESIKQVYGYNQGPYGNGAMNGNVWGQFAPTPQYLTDAYKQQQLNANGYIPPWTKY